MDTIVQVILMIACAWLAYLIASGERRARSRSGAASVGIYLAIFGGTVFGVLQMWSWLSPKLTDTVPSKNNLLFAGIVVVIALVVFILDLVGKIDLLGMVRNSVNRPSTGGTSASGD